MFISKLTLNTRNRDVLRDLDSAYEMHRTVTKAFPSQVYGGYGRILHRVDDHSILLIQSEREPDWNLLPSNYLSTAPMAKEFAPSFTTGQRLKFKIRANPTYKNEETNKYYGIHKEDDQYNW